MQILIVCSHRRCLKKNKRRWNNLSILITTTLSLQLSLKTKAPSRQEPSSSGIVRRKWKLTISGCSARRSTSSQSTWIPTFTWNSSFSSRIWALWEGQTSGKISPSLISRVRPSTNPCPNSSSHFISSHKGYQNSFKWCLTISIFPHFNVWYSPHC